MAVDRAYYHEAEPSAAETSVQPLLNMRIDDTRIQARAYARWEAMLRGRACPSIEDLEPAGVAGPCDLLIDLRRDLEDPELTCIGGALISDCGKRAMKRLSQVPQGSYLELLAAHYRYVVTSRHPIAFDGQRPCCNGRCAEYRAILLPLSSNGEMVDFVYGTISWREPADDGLVAGLADEVERCAPAAARHCLPLPWPSRDKGLAGPLPLRA